MLIIRAKDKKTPGYALAVGIGTPCSENLNLVSFACFRQSQRSMMVACAFLLMHEFHNEMYSAH